MQGRTWKNIESGIAEEVKKYLLDHGGTDEEVKSPHEAWRIGFSDSTFTYYKKGTLYSTPSQSSDPAVISAWTSIDSLVGSKYVLPSRDFLIGLDETGKGEVLGHTVLTGVIFPKELFKELDLLVGPADTKKSHEFDYWDRIFKDFDRFRSRGFDFITEKVPPWHVDKFNLNKIMDVVYQRVLSIFFRGAEVSKCRIVLDDYGLGPTLNRFLSFLKIQGAETVVTHNADETYLEVKAASLVSKRTRQEVIKRLDENPEFRINGLAIGSGNAGDEQTLNWLRKWRSSGREWPWFVKRSFKTIRKIEGKTGEVKKLIPPIKEELLSKEFIEKFNEGHLSIQSLSVFCPHCGGLNKAMTFAIYEANGRRISEMKCPSCEKLIDDAGITLRYYCGYVVPDSSIIRRGLLSKDLERARFFEDFNIVLPVVVRKECNGMTSGKREFEDLARFASLGRIRLEASGRVAEIPDGLSSVQRDEMITDVALRYNAILITADNAMKAYALSKNIFTIFI